MKGSSGRTAGCEGGSAGAEETRLRVDGKDTYMKSKMALVLLLTGFLSATLIAKDSAVTDGFSNGRAWNGMAVSIKFVYLVGLADGLLHAQGELMTVMFAKPTPGQESKAAEVVPSLLPPGKGFPEMIAALDLFYVDARNLDIPIPMAVRHQRAVFEGRDYKQLEESLRKLRILYRMFNELDTLNVKK
jgi:hypothetical protein